MKKTYSILFIGNSYTYYNDMPKIFAEIARASSYDVTVDSIAKGGYTLEKMTDPKDEYGAQVDAALSGSKKYDFVIIQEQSIRPASEEVGEFYKAVRNLAARIRATGAAPILYSTWGREEGSAKLEGYGWTNEIMTWRIAAAYSAIGAELDIPVAFAGLSFYDVHTSHREVVLYNDDKSHPAYAGSYLAAATLVAKIFDTHPFPIHSSEALSEDTEALLLLTAERTVFRTPPIPDEYKTLSDGIGT